MIREQLQLNQCILVRRFYFTNSDIRTSGRHIERIIMISTTQTKTLSQVNHFIILMIPHLRIITQEILQSSKSIKRMKIGRIKENFYILFLEWFHAILRNHSHTIPTLSGVPFK